MVYIALGANLGDRYANLQRAIVLLAEAGVSVLRQSSVYETEPRDVPGQPWFLNMVLECQTRLFPRQLMKKLLGVEAQMGRDRSANAFPRGPRIIDIDLLLYRGAVIHTPELTLPHPRMAERRFVLEPLLELQPDLKDPRTGQKFSRAFPAVRGQQIMKWES